MIASVVAVGALACVGVGTWLFWDDIRCFRSTDEMCLAREADLREAAEALLDAIDQRDVTAVRSRLETCSLSDRELDGLIRDLNALGSIGIAANGVDVVSRLDRGTVVVTSSRPDFPTAWARIGDDWRLTGCSVLERLVES